MLLELGELELGELELLLFGRPCAIKISVWRELRVTVYAEPKRLARSVPGTHSCSTQLAQQHSWPALSCMSLVYIYTPIHLYIQPHPQPLYGHLHIEASSDCNSCTSSVCLHASWRHAEVFPSSLMPYVYLLGLRPCRRILNGALGCQTSVHILEKFHCSVIQHQNEPLP